MITLNSVDDLLRSWGLRPPARYGLALSGGGARGFAHIGVLQALESFKMKPDILAGVSAGSIAAVLYGAGLTPNDILQCFAAHTKFNEFAEWVTPRQGFFTLSRFAKILDSWLPVKKLEEMPIPTVVCATDFRKGTSVGWTKGDIVPRVLASCSIPVIFKPVRIEGDTYIDGGVLRNLPAWPIRDLCTTLIGSNCNPLNKEYKFKNSILDVAWRSYQLAMKANVLQDLNLCDIVIRVDGMHTYKTFDLMHMRRIATEGYDAACRALEAYHSKTKLL